MKKESLLKICEAAGVIVLDPEATEEDVLTTLCWHIAKLRNERDELRATVTEKEVEIRLSGNSSDIRRMLVELLGVPGR